MNMFRINLRISATNAPRLFERLKDRPPRERAEYVRAMAERGIKLGDGIVLVPESIPPPSTTEAGHKTLTGAVVTTPTPKTAPPSAERIKEVNFNQLCDVFD